MASAAGAGAGATDGGGAGPKETKYEAARRKDAAERARKRLAGLGFEVKHRLFVDLEVDEARGNQSLVQMHNLTLVDLGLFFGNYVRIMGNVKLSSVGIAVGCDKIAAPRKEAGTGRNSENGHVAFGATTRHNIKVSAGDVVSVKRVEPVVLEAVKLAPVKETIGDLDEAQLAEMVNKYFANSFVADASGNPVYRPATTNNLIKLPGPSGGKQVIFQVSECVKGGKQDWGVVRPPTPGELAGLNQDPPIQITHQVTHVEIVKAIKMADGMKAINRVGYSDIGGLRSQLEQIRENVELPLKFPKLFKSIGVKPPKGVLLHGPPGVGKTLIFKAILNELGVGSWKINGPEILSNLMGKPEQMLRDAFKELNERAPAILFIDEIDSIAPNREKTQDESMRRIVTTLLTQMDGMGSQKNVMVIGATNRPDTLDPALRRSGRFDCEVTIPVPDVKAREEILDILINKHGLRVKKHDPEKTEEENKGWVDIKRLAKDTHGFVGADLDALCTGATQTYLHRRTPALKDLEPGDITEEWLESLEVTMADFKKTLTTTLPSSVSSSAFHVTNPGTSFDDIGGLEDMKRELKEMVTFPVKHADLFERLGLVPPKGALMYGPPGCGKTLLAEAMASECEANFMAVGASDLINKMFGSSEANVREVFETARQASPCIVFFDEFDSIAKKRTQGGSANDSVVNQILTEMDGMNKRNNVFVIGATNRLDTLDDAVCRTGRMDQFLFVDMPDLQACKAIAKAHLDKVKDGYPDLNLDRFAQDCFSHNLTGSDIQGVIQAAVQRSIRRRIAARKAGQEVKVWPLSADCVEAAMRNCRVSLSPEDVAMYRQMAREHSEAAPKSISGAVTLPDEELVYKIRDAAVLASPPEYGKAATERAKAAKEAAAKEAAAKVVSDITATGAGAGGGAGAGATSHK